MNNQQTHYGVVNNTFIHDYLLKVMLGQTDFHSTTTDKINLLKLYTTPQITIMVLKTI